MNQIITSLRKAHHKMSIKSFLTAGIVSMFIMCFCQARSQNILIRTADTLKIKAALRIIERHEPEIYSRIISRSYIQFGINPERPTVNFAITDDAGGIQRHWIMLNPVLMNDHSNDIIAAIIVHEAMHLGFKMYIYKGLGSDNIELNAKHEHTIIYNHELLFMRKIGASKSDIESIKQIMMDFSIPVI
jgi:hypothetical protein